MALPSSGQITLNQVYEEAVKGGFPTAGIVGSLDYADEEEHIDDLAIWGGWDSAPNLNPAQPHDIEEFYSASVEEALDPLGSTLNINSVPGSDSTFIFRSCIYLKSGKAVIGWHEGIGSATQMYLRTFNAPTTGSPTTWGAEYSVLTNASTLFGGIQLVTLEGGAEDAFFGMFTEQIQSANDKRRLAVFSVNGSGTITEKVSVNETAEEDDFYSVAYLRREHHTSGSSDVWFVMTITKDASTGRPEYRIWTITRTSLGGWSLVESDQDVQAADSTYSFDNRYTFVRTPTGFDHWAAIGMIGIADGSKSPKQLMLSAQVPSTSFATVTLFEETSGNVDSGYEAFEPIHAAFCERTGATLRDYVLVAGHEIDTDGTTKIGGQLKLGQDTGNTVGGLLDYYSTLNFADSEIDDCEIHYLEDDGTEAYFVLLYRLASDHETLKIQLCKVSASPSPDQVYLLGNAYTVASDLEDSNIPCWSAYVYPGQSISAQRVYVCWGRDGGSAARLACYQVTSNLTDL